jgi:hypothetical protein
MNLEIQWRHVAIIVCAVLWSARATGAQGEMGRGIPQFGSYGGATGVQTIVWCLDDAATPFPAGCPTIGLTAATMGMDSYKIAIATMLAARTSGRHVRFYAHAPRDTGCGVDYVEMQ